ncbi:hypothetical protein LTR62_006945 [Meristemomyces frigidus]|uniref:SUN-like protein 1 n=1 Tax=Meristemomyces frigidus TaxID=1508187 RepID=A0AAN7YML6_9PEZI|nr:hypothetical protein LTR62_006945 [Meristemomyces frigidus]
MSWLLLGTSLLSIISASHAQIQIDATAGLENRTSTTVTDTEYAVVTPGFPSTETSSKPSISTCVSGTVNYITHTLPQQCLRIDRASASTNITAPSVTSSLTVQETSLGATSSTAIPPGSSDSSRLAAQSHAEPHDATSSSNADTASTVSIDPSSSPDASSTSGLEQSTHTPVIEDDILSDSVIFLSFEDWKKQNLAKTGQSSEHLDHERTNTGERHRPANGLDSLGEENEINLDFVGFGGLSSTDGSGEKKSAAVDSSSDRTALPRSSEATPATLLSKDAGRTCKERTNYASFDCSANILKNNKESKHASSVLVENKDSYMLNRCSANNKFFIVELCNDIHIDTIVLANYEFFSSSFRHFRVSVSDRYPVKEEKWRELGTFEARNAREVQAFLVEEPQIWARYLRIEFLTHYGSEYYCPVSLLRVHGRTMMQEFRQEEEMARGELAEDEASFEPYLNVPNAVEESIVSVTTADVKHQPQTDATHVETPQSTAGASSISQNDIAQEQNHTADTKSRTPTSLEGSDRTLTPSSLTCAVPTLSSRELETAPVHGASRSILADDSATLSSTASEPLLSSSQVASASAHHDPVQQNSAVDATEGSSLPIKHPPSSNTTLTTAPSIVAEPSSAPATPATTIQQLTNGTVTDTTPPSLDTSTLTNSTRNPTSTPSPPPQPQPASQESFFKSISKRLHLLESNSTLSLQYIEAQSRNLREAFSKVEKRQISTTTAFLTTLNATVMTELHGFRLAYDQLWQSTIIELEAQRAQSQREMYALSTRLTFVADELVWQKRMGILQSTLLFLCLGLVLFARQGNGYVDMTLARQLVHRSQAALRQAGWESEEAGSPSSPGSRSPVALLRRRIWRRRGGGMALVGGTGEEGRSGRRRKGESGLGVEGEASASLEEDGEVGGRLGHEGDVEFELDERGGEDDVGGDEQEGEGEVEMDGQPGLTRSSSRPASSVDLAEEPESVTDRRAGNPILAQ